VDIKTSKMLYYKLSDLIECAPTDSCWLQMEDSERRSRRAVDDLINKFIFKISFKIDLRVKLGLNRFNPYKKLLKTTKIFVFANS
jgi:hypothetical protein